METKKEGFWALNSSDSERYEKILSAVGYLSNFGLHIFVILDDEEKLGAHVPLSGEMIIKDDKYFLKFKASLDGDKKITWKEVGPISKDTAEGLFIPIREYIIQKQQKGQLKNFLLFRKNYLTPELKELFKKMEGFRLEKIEKVKEQCFEQAARLRDKEKGIYPALIQEAIKIAEALNANKKFNWVTGHHIAEIIWDIDVS